MVVITKTPAETMLLAAELSQRLKKGDVLALSGPLGAGKTVFVKGLAKGLGIPEKTVRSPSFVLLLEYGGGRLPLYHFDFYRIREAAEVETIPFTERLATAGVVVIEWPERILPYLPAETIWVRIEMLDRHRRSIRVEAGLNRTAA